MPPQYDDTTTEAALSYSNEDDEKAFRTAQLDRKEALGEDEGGSGQDEGKKERCAPFSRLFASMDSSSIRDAQDEHEWLLEVGEELLCFVHRLQNRRLTFFSSFRQSFRRSERRFRPLRIQLCVNSSLSLSTRSPLVAETAGGPSLREKAGAFKKQLSGRIL